MEEEEEEELRTGIKYLNVEIDRTITQTPRGICLTEFAGSIFTPGNVGYVFSEAREYIFDACNFIDNMCTYEFPSATKIVFIGTAPRVATIILSGTCSILMFANMNSPLDCRELRGFNYRVNLVFHNVPMRVFDSRLVEKGPIFVNIQECRDLRDIDALIKRRQTHPTSSVTISGEHSIRECGIQKLNGPIVTRDMKERIATCSGKVVNGTTLSNCHGAKNLWVTDCRFENGTGGYIIDNCVQIVKFVGCTFSKNDLILFSPNVKKITFEGTAPNMRTVRILSDVSIYMINVNHELCLTGFCGFEYNVKLYFHSCAFTILELALFRRHDPSLPGGLGLLELKDCLKLYDVDAIQIHRENVNPENRCTVTVENCPKIAHG